MTELTVLEFEGFEFALSDGTVWRHAQPLKLTAKASAVLRHLVTRPQLVISKAEFFNAVWPGVSVSDWALTTCVREIRQVLGDDARNPRLIETVHRRGYRFRPVVTAKSASPSTVASDFGFGTRIGAEGTREASCIVGRQAELQALDSCYQTILEGDSQVAFVTGEPGIGKTTVVSTFLNGTMQPGGRPRPLIATGQCVEHYGSSEAYLPVLQALVQWCRADDGAALTSQLLRCAPTWLMQLPVLLDEPLARALRERAHAVTPHRMAREMADFIAAVAAEHPLVLCLEDLQWSDQSTLDLVVFLGQRRGLGRFLLLGTYRHADAGSAGHPLRFVTQVLETRARCVEVPLQLLALADMERYLARRFTDGPHEPRRRRGDAIERRDASSVDVPLASVGSALAVLIREVTEGNPLFMVTLLDVWLAQGVIRQKRGCWRIQWPLREADANVPTNVRHLIESQIERLDTLEREVLSTASLAGSEFSATVVAAAIEQPVDRVDDTCETLSRPGSFLVPCGSQRAPDGTLAGRYRFAHAMYRRAVADGLMPTRRAKLHAHIGRALEQTSGAQAVTVAGELAMHFEHAHDYERALHHYHVAAANARSRLAHGEAVGLLTRAIACSEKLPDTPARARQVATLLVSLGASLLVTEGYSATGFKLAFERARTLCESLHDDQHLFPVLVGLMRFEILQPDFARASTIGDALLQLAERANDATLRHGAHMLRGGSSLFQGQFGAARDHAERSLTLYHSRHSALTHEHGDNPEVLGSCWIALALWYLGYPDQAVTRMSEGVRIAEAAGEPLTLTFILFWSAFLHRWRGEVAAVRERLDQLVPLNEEHGVPHNVALGNGLRGWVLIQEGRVGPGIAIIRESLSDLRALGHGLGRPFFLALLAEGFGKAGDAKSGIAALQEAEDLVARTGERMHLAEIYRLRGELLEQLRASDADGGCRAEACYQRALDTAHQQQARSLQLRAAISLARLRRTQGRIADVTPVLREACEWFTEGLEGLDVRSARTLITELQEEEPRRSLLVVDTRGARLR